MSQRVRDVLVVNRRRQELVTRILQDPSLRLSLVTEPGCLPDYPDTAGMESVTLVENVQNLDEVRHATLDLMNRYTFDAVVGPAESSIPTAGYLRSYLGMPGIPFDVAHAFCNKNAMKARLRRAGLTVARCTLVPSAESVGPFLRKHGLPTVIKPAWGDGAANVHVVRDESDIAAISRPDGPLLSNDEAPFLIEDFVEFEDEYHCDGLVRDGEVRFVSVSKYTRPPLRGKGSVFGSHTLPADGDEARELAELHGEVVRAMGLSDSVTHLEVFRTRDGLVVGEIACRPGGGGIPQTLRRAYGFDVWEHFLATELNRPLEWTPDAAEGIFAFLMFPVRPGVVRRVPDPDVFADFPEVEKVDIKIGPGARISGMLYSTSMAGMAHCRVDSVDRIPGLVSALEKRFVVEYEDDEPEPRPEPTP
ncbi:ATP-grasp domain-containing protein [Streptomyces sp. 2132.2]|uniref:ATP-grasp domain-containing protein n=1 Tax=Streptomyces sp. 2132.2 TaxID=2485161 RepID=UPI000F47F0AE|nr:ATP-grasp domain-containing protein [Streptomyces sp. 2132.2]ROQ96959.1 ATP-grasp domain-containing protein [Streptomyces sp. 2132.2]